MQWKEELLEKLNSRINGAPISEAQLTNVENDEFRQIELVGEFEHEKEMLILQQSYNGKVGVHVVSPFKTVGGKEVIVNRGWVLYEEKHDKPEGQQKIVAVIRKNPRQGYFALKNEPQKNMWYNVNLPEMYAKVGAPVLDFYVEEKATEDDHSYPIALPKEIHIYNEHLQYVITWFSVSISLLAVYYFRFWHKKTEKKGEKK